MIEPQLTVPDGVVYDDASHTYLLDGVITPSVSKVLKVVDPDQYEGIAEDILQRAAERGNNGHSMIALDVRDELDYASVEGLLLEHWSAWDRFRHDFRFDCEWSERVICSRKLKLCGTLDLAGVIKHKRKPGRWLIDIKFTAARPELADVQTAGYDLLASESLPGWQANTPRGCLWITGSKYTFIEYTNPSDRAIFIAARTILTRREP